MPPRAAASTLAVLMLIATNLAPGTLARLDAAPAPPGDLERARALFASGNYNAALPYARVVFERLVRLHGDDIALRLDFAAALSNAAFESGPHGAATRSSVERVALTRELLQVLDGALAIARNGPEAAEVLDRRATTCFVWGFPWEGLVFSNAALRADPSNVEIRARAAEMVRRFRQLDH